MAKIKYDRSVVKLSWLERKWSLFLLWWISLPFTRIWKFEQKEEL